MQQRRHAAHQRSGCRAVAPAAQKRGCATAAKQVLVKAKKLKEMDERKAVFISPDRSQDERVARKALVTKLKELTVAQPAR